MMRGYAPINIPTIIVLLLLFLVSPVAAENIDPISDGSQFAWGENLGWLNLEPDGNLGNGVHVTSAGLTGYIWSENAGWISLSCENTATCGIVTYGVANDGIGNLSGYAWAENLGWINFAPAGENVFIDACGAFNGKAWGENVGWINFRSADTDHALAMTSWVSPVDEVAPSTFVPVPILPWYTGSIDITLDSADCGTGVSDVYLSLNGGGFTATPGSAAITPVTEEGCNTLNFYAVDIAGNTEPVQSETICIDVTSPVITIDSPADGIPIAVNSIVNADYSVTDPLSGVDTVTATMPVGTQMDTSVPGNWSFTVWATDVAGNAGMLTSNFEIYIPGNMDPDNTGAQYAWSENAGWINLQPLYGPGVTVTHTAVEGYAWSENAGWINFAPAGSGVVNRGGELSGYAWGENTGWISFACENTFTCAAIDYGVNIDMVTGLFSGYAWAENIGWINFAPVSTGAAKTTWVATDSDGDGHVAGIDCNDNDINISPDAVEICDGLDNNCDGNIDEGLTTDADGDGHSTPGSCEGTQDDCDDNNDQSFPGNTEVCDGIDNNCDAQIDEGAVWSNLGAVCSDGIGECNAPGTMVCDTNNPAGPAVCNAVALLPSAEICDGLDNNCDGSVDEGLTTDADGDGYSTPGSCEGTRDDCDDTDPLKNADSPEICDGIDNDCDGLVDDADQVSSGVPAFIRASLNHEGNEVSRDPVLPVISGDGNVVAFKSSATDMVPGDTNGTSDIFVRNLLTNELKRVNVHSSGAQANGFTLEFDMSEDGNFVAFTSAATNLVDNDTNNRWDIFVHDISANITTRVSVNSAGDAGNGDSRYPSISHDGRYVSFSSSANNIIPGVTAQIYRHDRDTGTTIVASLDAFGNPIASTPLQSVMSADGQAVVFVSTGDNIVLDDTNGVSDVFVHDFISARTVRVSEDSAGNAGNAVSQYPELSRDGRYVAFESIATNLVAGDTNGQLDIFVHDLILHTTVRASVGSNETEADSGSHNPAISNDGRYVAFDSSATNLVPGGSDTSRHIYVRDLQLGTTEIVGLKNAVDPGWSHGQEASVSAGGRYIAFESRSSSLVADDTNGRPDIFIWDRYAPLSYFTDIDNDGFGDPNDTAYACALPATNGIDNCPDIANPDQADIDNDGIGDVCDPDNDNDGLSDDDEINIYGTDPLNPDTDGDTVSDGDEITEGSDPLVYNPGQVLVDLYNSTNGPGWRISTGWLGPRGTECSWYRVTCDAGGQIISVDLSRNRLSGTIPETIGAL
ncbi:PD40 domain-containing protein, partial [bacterium]|nr:PD40 domain-containing protein [bacterium]